MPSVVELVGPDPLEVGEYDSALEPVLVRVSGVGHNQVSNAGRVRVGELLTAARADLREARILAGSAHTTSS